MGVAIHIAARRMDFDDVPWSTCAAGYSGPQAGSHWGRFELAPKHTADDPDSKRHRTDDINVVGPVALP